MPRSRDYNLPRHTNDSPIARARLKKGWTQAQLADAIGSNQQQIAGWESGARKPKMNALMRIGDAMGIDWTTLIEE